MKKKKQMRCYIQLYTDSVESPDEKDKTSKKTRKRYKYLNNDRDGNTGNAELYSDNPADEAPEGAVVGERCKQSSEDTVSEEK